jgi:hypothetical protein
MGWGPGVNPRPPFLTRIITIIIITIIITDIAFPPVLRISRHGKGLFEKIVGLNRKEVGLIMRVSHITVIR